MVKIISVLMITIWLIISSAYASPLKGLASSGKSELTWFLLSIYDAQLFTSTGQFNYGEYPQALEIRYNLDVAKDRLVKSIKSQWQEQAISHPQLEQWLIKLDNIFPNIKSGDKLIFLVDEDGNNQFFLNDKPIGRIADDDFPQIFLDIWLSNKTSFPDLRLGLIGETQ